MIQPQENPLSIGPQFEKNAGRGSYLEDIKKMFELSKIGTR
jgi:hypothetical protein